VNHCLSHAREILPKSFDLHSMIVYWQRLANFIHAIHQKDKGLVRLLLQDELIEPHRAKLIPGFKYMCY
jgi:homoserine kinase